MSDMYTDPYQPEGYSPADTLMKPSGQMEYMRSIHYIFENPNWLQNILFTALCAFIPLIGPLVNYGYQFEIIETLHLRRGASYPDFDFNRFVDYLVRGLWVFLVAFVLGLATSAISFGVAVLVAVLVGGAGVAGGEEGVTIGMLIAMPLLIIGSLVFSILVQMFVVPCILRAGLTQDFGAAFDFGFAKQFVSNTWPQMIVTGLFSAATAIVLLMLGLAMMCVGIIFTMPIVVLLQAHLGFQLYEFHLARGGDHIPIQPRKSF
ncbi:MAG: hypothetical protein CMJ64_24060 [Planctomycetaceae bacterium]|nr:hypothetical protein [Planctomycetaceae bacterium]